MAKMTFNLDDSIANELNSKSNKAEFVRQAIIEKLKRESFKELETDNTKDFVKSINKISKSHDSSQENLNNLNTQFVQHDSKMILGFAKVEKQFIELMSALIKNNIYAAHAAGRDWIAENKEAINNDVEIIIDQTLQRVNGNG